MSKSPIRKDFNPKTRVHPDLVKQLPQANVQEPSQVIVHRLSPGVYEKLVKELPKLFVGPETSGIQTAYHSGIQLVLQKLREGIVL